MSKELAEEHWKYVCSLCEKMYKEAFIHGYKHGVEDEETSLVGVMNSLGLKSKTYAVGSEFEHERGKGWKKKETGP